MVQSGYLDYRLVGVYSVFFFFFGSFPFSESEQHDFPRWFQTVSIFGMSGSATNR